MKYILNLDDETPYDVAHHFEWRQQLNGEGIDYTKLEAKETEKLKNDARTRQQEQELEDVALYTFST